MSTELLIICKIVIICIHWLRLESDSKKHDKTQAKVSHY